MGFHVTRELIIRTDFLKVKVTALITHKVSLEDESTLVHNAQSDDNEDFSKIISRLPQLLKQ